MCYIFKPGVNFYWFGNTNSDNELVILKLLILSPVTKGKTMAYDCFYIYFFENQEVALY